MIHKQTKRLSSIKAQTTLWWQSRWRRRNSKRASRNARRTLLSGLNSVNCEFIIISSSIGNSALISNSIISTSINTIIYIIIASITITIIIISLSSSSPSPSSPPSSPPPSSSIQYDHHLHTGGSQHRGIRVLLSSMFCTGSIVNVAFFFLHISTLVGQFCLTWCLSNIRDHAQCPCFDKIISILGITWEWMSSWVKLPYHWRWHWGRIR